MFGWVKRKLARVAANKALDKVDQVAADMAAGKETKMNPKIKALAEGAAFAFAAAFFTAFGPLLKDGFQNADLKVAAGVGLAAAAAYVRGLWTSNPFKPEDPK